MKLCLLIAGYLRSIENNIENIKSKIIQDYEADIYLHITKNEDKEDKYYNNKHDIQKIINLLNPKLIIIENNIKFKEYRNIYNIYYKHYKLNKEREKIEKIENITYDVIIKIRPDLYIEDCLNFNNLENFVYLPEDTKSDSKKINNKPELCDILAYGNPLMMEKYLNIYNFITDEIIELYKNTENILYNYLNNRNIKYKKIKINFYVILSLCNTIAISGDSASGKTTIAKLISDNIKNNFILECDRYHKWERGNKNWENITHLNPHANYIAKMEKDVFDLKIGKNIYQVDYDHSKGKFTDKKILESKDNIIVCGLHSLYGNNDYNIKIFMDTDEILRIKWKIDRDINKRGYTKEKIIQQINNRKEDYNKYILPQKYKADIIIKYIWKDKLILNLALKKKYHQNNYIDNYNYSDDIFLWYKFEKENYNEIILSFIKQIMN
jgi:uridine kinase